MSNHPNRAQVRVPVRLLEELAGALDLALSRLEWSGIQTPPDVTAHGRQIIDEARGRIRIIGRANREAGNG